MAKNEKRAAKGSKKSTAGKKKKAKEKSKKAPRKKWAQNVKTVSTFPPEGLFTKDAETIARVMATKKVSPKGIGSGIKMVQYFINRSGKELSASRRRELEKAKEILQEKLAKKKRKKKKAKKAVR